MTSQQPPEGLSAENRALINADGVLSATASAAGFESAVAFCSTGVSVVTLNRLLNAARSTSPAPDPKAGAVLVPREPTREMLNAAVDVDSFKLGDISPLGFRCSPQMLFERCYAAMLAAAPTPTKAGEREQVAEAVERLGAIEPGQGYADAVLRAYGFHPVGQFYAGLATMRSALAEARSEVERLTCSALHAISKETSQ